MTIMEMLRHINDRIKEELEENYKGNKIRSNNKMEEKYEENKLERKNLKKII